MNEFQDEKERIMAVSQLRHSILQVMNGIAMIRTIQANAPEFTQKYYDQIPNHKIGGLSDWLLAANQARDNMTSREVLFWPTDRKKPYSAV